MSPQIWSAEAYARNTRFVSDLGMVVLELLAPRAGERVLDVGCGDGVLTKKIADLGSNVVGVDSSLDFVAAARQLGLEVVQTSASAMGFGPDFDAVFSNAALHWMKDADTVIHRIAQALRPGGRFVAEMGGARMCEYAASGLDRGARSAWLRRCCREPLVFSDRGGLWRAPDSRRI